MHLGLETDLVRLLETFGVADAVGARPRQHRGHDFHAGLMAPGQAEAHRARKIDDFGSEAEDTSRREARDQRARKLRRRLRPIRCAARYAGKAREARAEAADPRRRTSARAPATSRAPPSDSRARRAARQRRGPAPRCRCWTPAARPRARSKPARSARAAACSTSNSERAASTALVLVAVPSRIAPLTSMSPAMSSSQASQPSKCGAMTLCSEVRMRIERWAWRLSRRARASTRCAKNSC